MPTRMRGIEAMLRDNADAYLFYLTVLHGLSIRARDGRTPSTMHIIDNAMNAWDVVVTGPRRLTLT